MLKTYQFRLMPSREQSETLDYLLRHTCRLYNEMLGMREEAYRRGGKISFYDQQLELTHTRAHSEAHRAVWRKFQHGVLMRLDRAYKAYFRKKKAGEKTKPPRYKSVRKWKSLDAPQALVYEKGAVKIKGVGAIKCISRREITGAIKNAAIKKDVFGYRITIVAEAEARQVAKTGAAIGIDLGIKEFLTTSAGAVVANPRLLQRSLRHLRISQRALSRKVKGSRRHAICKRRVAQTHWKVAERRRGLHNNAVNALVTQCDTIAVEDLQVKNMVRNKRLSRAISDVGWGAFIERLVCKAAEVGKQVIKVSPHNTSQACSSCGRIVAKPLSERVHSCSGCGLVIDRDHNAARNILLRAGISPPPVNARGCPVRLGDAAAAFCAQLSI